jgi:hypothetical protein
LLAYSVDLTAMCHNFVGVRPSGAPFRQVVSEEQQGKRLGYGTRSVPTTKKAEFVTTGEKLSERLCRKPLVVCLYASDDGLPLSDEIGVGDASHTYSGSHERVQSERSESRHE